MSEHLTVRADELQRLLQKALDAVTRVHEELVRSMDECQLRLQDLEAEWLSSGDTDSEARDSLRLLKEELLFSFTQREVRQGQIVALKATLARPDLMKALVWRIDLSFMSALMKLRDARLHLTGDGWSEERRAPREFGKLHPVLPVEPSQGVASEMDLVDRDPAVLARGRGGNDQHGVVRRRQSGEGLRKKHGARG